MPRLRLVSNVKTTRVLTYTRQTFGLPSDQNVIDVSFCRHNHEAMSKLRRYFRPGDWVFLTHVTYNRRPLLVDFAEDLLDVLTDQCGKAGASLEAWVILPDHIHMVVDSIEADVSRLMKRTKLAFSAKYRVRSGLESGRVWQLRFYDHIIRDADDLRRHLDYIHYNPVKHGFVEDPFMWRWSSLGRFLEQGQYERNWRMKSDDEGDFGELE
jgi:putative transposase